FWLKSLITRSPASTISCRGVTLLSQRNRAYFRFVGRVRRTHTLHIGLINLLIGKKSSADENRLDDYNPHQQAW
ncbi:hypothetical protein, partial [Pseudovibrio sp. Ad37]|uniref:hypothetical protein n=1 Tax=Pseudovibrio sp. Ad37 TaxID=989422 RepID=UPI0019D3B6C5